MLDFVATGGFGPEVLEPNGTFGPVLEDEELSSEDIITGGSPSDLVKASKSPDSSSSLLKKSSPRTLYLGLMEECRLGLLKLELSRMFFSAALLRPVTETPETLSLKAPVLFTLISSGTPNAETSVPCVILA